MARGYVFDMRDGVFIACRFSDACRGCGAFDRLNYRNISVAHRPQRTKRYPRPSCHPFVCLIPFLIDYTIIYYFVYRFAISTGYSEQSVLLMIFNPVYCRPVASRGHIRDPEIDPVAALALKRRIDRSNQERTDMVEELKYFRTLYFEVVNYQHRESGSTACRQDIPYGGRGEPRRRHTRKMLKQRADLGHRLDDIAAGANI